MFTFKGSTDLKLAIVSNAGSEDFKDGEEMRELFIIYDGPAMSENRKRFFEELNKWLDKEEHEKSSSVHRQPGNPPNCS